MNEVIAIRCSFNCPVCDNEVTANSEFRAGQNISELHNTGVYTWGQADEYGFHTFCPKCHSQLQFDRIGESYMYVMSTNHIPVPNESYIRPPPQIVQAQITETTGGSYVTAKYNPS